jgi:ammonium transporter Rh
VFLWLYWPSFNGALAGTDNNARHRSVINTTLSISASAFSAFVASRLLRHGGRFNMIDVQNATLAGGVAMGACANMLPQAWGALLIGTVAGALSTFGYGLLW